MNGYQLLNEVGSGGTVSSLFTILSLFTEDVKISWQHSSESEAGRGETAYEAPPPESITMPSRMKSQRPSSLAIPKSGSRGRSRSPASSIGSTVIIPEVGL